jgi:GH43 family beta-xylosidase
MFSFPDYHRTPAEKLIENRRVQEALPSSLWVWQNSDYMENNYWIPTLATVLYVLFLYFGTAFMKNREPFDLRTPLVLWNFGLACMSQLLGFLARSRSRCSV